MCLRLLYLEYFIVRCSQRRKRRGTPRVNVKSLRTWEEEINEQCRQPSGSRQNRSIYISSRVFLFTVLILSPLDGYSKSKGPHHHSPDLHLSVYTSGAITAIENRSNRAVHHVHLSLSSPSSLSFCSLYSAFFECSVLF